MAEYLEDVDASDADNSFFVDEEEYDPTQEVEDIKSEAEPVLRLSKKASMSLLNLLSSISYVVQTLEA
ncbi:unnamed protein product [Calypogeia fissa]